VDGAAFGSYVERVEAAGGTFTSSVSKNTDYVLAGEDEEICCEVGKG
jgi:NAD-dependent DNA ligase